MKLSVFIISILFSARLLYAQSAEDEVIRLKQSMGEQAVQSPVEAETEKEDGLRGHWNFSVGTSYTYMHGYGSMMGLYAAPTYTLPINDRWAVHGGLVASNYTGLGSMQMPGGEFQASNNFSSLAVFAAASYTMSDRLILHGSGLKNLSSYPLVPLVPGMMDNLSLGATYRLGNNVSIGASISVNQGRGYYNVPPFGGASFGSPFGPPFGW